MRVSLGQLKKIRNLLFWTTSSFRWRESHVTHMWNSRLGRRMSECIRWTIYIVHLFFCKSVESRESRGKMIQKAPVALLVMTRKCLVKNSLQSKRGTKRFTSETQVTTMYFTSRLRYVTNDMIHKDLGITTVQEISHERSIKHRTKLEPHSNPLLQFLPRDNVIRRLKRRWPADL
jgi:hypothetical protein